MPLSSLISELKALADSDQARNLQRFFKTGPGQYGEGDVFWGIKVPAQRRLVKKYADLSCPDIQKLLQSPVHEQRLTGLLILVAQYQKYDRKADQKQLQAIFTFYLANTAGINNWDLVDLSAPNIVGAYLLDRDRRPLFILAKSDNLWERRIAMLATLRFIKANDYSDALKIARLLLSDRQDLIHKAVGWMLREIGKRDQPTTEKFLRAHYQKLPRTTLRYAIERFPEAKRRQYLANQLDSWAD